MSKLPIFTLLFLPVVLGGCDRLDALRARVRDQAAPERAPIDPVQAQQAAALLANAAATLQSRDAVSARMNVSVQLFGQVLMGSGLYLEQDPQRSRLMRMELNFQVDGKPTSLVQICDGQHFWSYRQAGKESSLNKVDLARLDEAWQAAVGNGPPLPWMMLGGLPKLLHALNETFVFARPEASRLQDLAVWRLRGEWRPERLAALLPQYQKALSRGQTFNSAKLPEHLPDEVLLFLGQEDLFPYRLEYRRRSDTPDASGPNPLLLALQLSEVTLNVPLDPYQFRYSPGGLKDRDVTAEALQQFNLTSKPK